MKPVSIINIFLLTTMTSITLNACAQISETAGKMMPKPHSSAEKTDVTTSNIPADPYLWLEDVEGEKALAQVRDWNKRSLDELQADARYEGFLADAKAILNSDERIPSAALRNGYAYNFWQDADHIRGLWRRMPVADYLTGGVDGAKDWNVLLDLDALARAEEENWVYKGVDCLAPDYTKCMITLSRGGSDASVRREFDIATKSFVKGGFELAEAKAGTAWLDQNTLLVGSDFGEGSKTESGYPRTTRLWKRGTKIEDAPELFAGEKSDVGVWPFAEVSHGKTYAGIVRAITFYESEYYMLHDDNELKALPLPPKSELKGMTAGKIIASLQQDWQAYKSGAVIAMDPTTYETNLVFMPKDRQATDGITTSENDITITLLDNIVGKVVKMSPSNDGWTENRIGLPGQGVVSVSSVDGKTGDMLVYFENPSTPETLYYVKNGGKARALKSTPAFFEAQDVMTQQFEAISKDGTKIPYFVTAKKQTLSNGPAPTIQYGYGGFQISILPNYSGTTGKLWLENGGVYVIANIRGGGEFGPAWHQAGLKQNRQKVYDDFFAVSEDLIAKGITTPQKLGILGGSNGGLLMGVAMTQRPDLYNAIGIGVPLLDMLRYDKLLAGASWVGEYGDPDNPEERPTLEAISPYHNLEADTDYPRVYLFTSTKDDRVHPGHARKMAAKLEAMDKDFLYYENIEGGHSASANRDQMAKRLALQYVYFSTQLAE